MASERVQKILAKAGISSRRKAEELITEGSVTINGKVAKLGDKAELGVDAVKVNGKLLQGAEEPIYLAMHKPRGVISMLEDPENRPTLRDFLSKLKTRVFPIGRLDFNSDGLIILTNDGNFAEQLQRRDDIPRVYHVKVKGHPDPKMIGDLERGAKIGNRMVRPHSVRVAQDLGNKSRIELVLLGAGAMDVKALFEMKGFLVDKITRTAIGHITLRGIVPGQYRLLKASQVEALLTQPELGLKPLEFEAEKAEEKAKRLDRARETRLERSRERSAEKRGFGGGGERRGGFAGGAKRGGFGSGAKRGGFGPRRDAGGEGAGFGGSERRGGFGGGEKRGGFGGGAKRGGFGASAGGERRGGFGAKRGGFGGGEKRGFGGGERRGGFGGGEKRGGFGGGEKRGGFGGGEKRGGFGGGEKRGFGGGEKRGGFGGGEKRGGFSRDRDSGPAQEPPGRGGRRRIVRSR